MKDFKKMLSVFAFTTFVIITLGFLASNATAQDVCDVEAIESAAAYALCNAYCEAMDCDGSFPQASETACDKIKSNFTKFTQLSLFPCEAGWEN